MAALIGVDILGDGWTLAWSTPGLAYNADQAWAGLRTVASGQPQATYYQGFLTGWMGLSEGKARAVDLATGLGANVSIMFAGEPVKVLPPGYQAAVENNNFYRDGAEWFDPNGVVYPPNGGFASTPAKRMAEVGEMFSRDGGEGGRFLSSVDAPFEGRSLLNASLYEGHHVYQVLQPFELEDGEVVPWFGQPGGASQYLIIENFKKPDGEVGIANVNFLLKNKMLEEIK
jgi:hypothetical protein